MFIYRQKINFILPVFLEILQIYCRLAILGVLDMPGYSHSKWYYQLVENFCVYMQGKNQYGQKRIFFEKWLSHFLNIPIIYHRAKN